MKVRLIKEIIVEEVVVVDDALFKESPFKDEYYSKYELTEKGIEYFEKTPLVKSDETLLAINDMQGKLIAEW